MTTHDDVVAFKSENKFITKKTAGEILTFNKRNYHFSTIMFFEWTWICLG
jgi:hypothetical protein